MRTEPKIEERPEQPYMGARTQVAMDELPTAIQQGLGDVFTYLGQEGLHPVGPPFIRYLVIDMAGKLDIVLGVPVVAPAAGDGHVTPGVLPAGRYATLIYTDVTKGIEANGALLDWGAAQGLAWDSWPTAHGDGFGGRYEAFLTDPADEPDPAQWATEVAIRLADDTK